LELAFEFRFLELDARLGDELEIFCDPCGLTFSCAKAIRALRYANPLHQEDCLIDPDD